MEKVKIDLDSLGFTKDEIKQRVIDLIAEQVRGGECEEVESQFDEALDAAIKEKINTAIDKLAQKHVLPNVAEYIENVTLKETNRWGEEIGRQKTFIEYLVHRAEAYMSEKVNHDGKGKGESQDSYWSAGETRITHLIHKHLHFSIERAMKESLKTANSSIAGGIEKAVKLKLDEISKSLTVGLETKR